MVTIDLNGMFNQQDVDGLVRATSYPATGAEEESPLVYHESAGNENNRPSKGILKPNNDNTNHTLYSKTVPIPLKGVDDTQTQNRRRVSFAPEVTLHKIDLIPQHSDKRRETIASFPNRANEYAQDDAGREMLSDSSDEDEEISDGSFQNLEADADKIVSGMHRVRESNQFLQNIQDDDDEEQTMELTGQIKQTEQNDSGQDNNNDDQTMEFTGLVQPTAQKIGDSTNNTPQSKDPAAPALTQVEQVEVNNPLSQDQDQDQDHEDETMDFTGQIPIPKLSPVPDSDDDVPDHDIPNDAAPQLTSSESEDENDQMDMTSSIGKQIQINDNLKNPEEVTMEVTNVFQSNFNNVSNFELKDGPSNQSGNSDQKFDGQNNDELTMDFTTIYNPPVKPSSPPLQQQRELTEKIHNISLVDKQPSQPVKDIIESKLAESGSGGNSNIIHEASGVSQPENVLVENTPKIAFEQSNNDSFPSDIQLDTQNLQNIDYSNSQTNSHQEIASDMSQPGVTVSELGLSKSSLQEKEHNPATQESDQPYGSLDGDTNSYLHMNEQNLFQSSKASTGDDDHLDTIQEESMIQSQNDENDQESRMELTLPMSTSKTLDNNVGKDSQPMQLTQDIGTVTETTAPQPPQSGIEKEDSSQPMQSTQQIDKIELIIDNGSVINSQPMHLTQQNDDITYNQNKRKNDDPEADHSHKMQKLSKEIEVNTVTTTIPLADVSLQEESDDDFEPVTINQFLRDAEIGFFDNLDLGTQPPSRVRLSIFEDEPKIEDYYKANTKVPLLEVFKLNCDELINKIEEDRNNFELIKDSTFPENQAVFKKFYRSTPGEQFKLKSQFKLLKDFAREKAREVWYDWRIKLMENLSSDLELKFETLQKDKFILTENLRILDPVYDEVKLNFLNVKRELTKTLEMKQHFEKIDIEQIKTYKNQLTDINKELVNHQQKIKTGEFELKQITSVIAEYENEILLLKNKANQLEMEIKDLRHFDIQEIEALHMKFKLLQALSNLKYVQASGNSIIFEFKKLIHIKIDFSNLNDSNNITYSLVDRELSFPPFYNWFLLNNFVLKLPYTLPSTTVLENFSNFKKYWQGFSNLDYDIYKISLKLPVKILDDNDDDVIRFSIRYYSPKHGFKILLNVAVNLPDLIEYPKKVSISGEIVRSTSELESKFILDNLIKDTVKNGLLTEETYISLSP